MVLTELPNVESAHVAIEIDPLSPNSVIPVTVIRTKLQIDSKRPDYDKVKLDALLEAITSHMQQHPHMKACRVEMC